MNILAFSSKLDDNKHALPVTVHYTTLHVKNRLCVWISRSPVVLEPFRHITIPVPVKLAETCMMH